MTVEQLRDAKLGKVVSVTGYLLYASACPHCYEAEGLECKVCEDAYVRIGETPSTPVADGIWIGLGQHAEMFVVGQKIRVKVTHQDRRPRLGHIEGPIPRKWFTAGQVEAVVTPLNQLKALPLDASTLTEGWLETVSSCAPCPQGMICEACVRPHVTLLPELKSKPEQRVFVWVRQHLVGLELGKKLKLRVKVVRPEAQESRRFTSDFEN